MRRWTVKMPISVEIGVRKKKEHRLNLNLYRNANMHINNNIKKEYARIAHSVLPAITTPLKQVALTYTLFLPNKIKRDISNVLSIVDKSFCDAMVRHGIIEDDNYEFLKKITYKFGGFDEDKKGYVLIDIEEVKDE